MEGDLFISLEEAEGGTHLGGDTDEEFGKTKFGCLHNMQIMSGELLDAHIGHDIRTGISILESWHVGGFIGMGTNEITWEIMLVETGGATE